MNNKGENKLIKDLPRYFKVYQIYLGRRMYIILVLVLASALSEGVGILMLLPLLQSLSVNDSGATISQSDYMSGQILEMLENIGLSGSVITVLLVICGAFIVKGIMQFGSQSYAAYLTGQLLRELKGRLFNDYSRMSYNYYASRDTGHFINVIIPQIDQMMNAFLRMIQCCAQLVNSIIYITLAFLVTWRFGLMALLVGFVLMFLLRHLNYFVRGLSRKMSTENSNLTKLLIQSLHAFKYLTATAQMRQLRKGILASIHKLTGFQMRSGIAGAFTSSIREPIVVVFILFIVLVQINYLNQPLAPIMVSIVLFNRGLNAVMGIQSSWQGTMNMIGGLEMVRDEFIVQHQQKEVGGDKFIEQIGQGIKLHNVYYQYDDKLDYVLRDINLEIPVRTSVALIGESGSGKSTLVDLITLMLKPCSGCVMIDGVPGEQIELTSWRNQIGYVSQETVVFDDTVANNICLWEGDINKDKQLFKRVQEAAQQAHLDHFIETLSDGYDTLVGDRGLRLSGGQRQRLFIARELFRKPNLLILDEATSALDSESERAIQQSIDALKGQITVILIAHRLSTIRNVDYVYILDKGRLVEQGSYKELRSGKDSRLGKMIKMQTI